MLLRLAISQMLYNAVNQFSNLFINTYLFKVNHDVRVVAHFNFFLFLSWGICFYLGFFLCQKSTRIGVVAAGFASLAAMGILLAGCGDPFILGILIGAAGGFFWPSYLAIYRMLGKQSEGASTFARVSILASVATIFIPVLFGHLVEGSGYVTGFITLLILSAGLMAISFFLPSYQTEKVVIRASSFSHTGFFSANSLQGFYFSFIGIASGLLVFMSGQGEANVGTFATFYGVLTLVINIAVAYFVPDRFNKPVLLVSTVLYIVSAFLFLGHWSGQVIAYNFLIAGAGPLFSNPVVGLNMAYINRAFENGSEGLVIREWGLSVGRLLFFAYMSFVGLDVHSISFYIFLFISSIFPLLIYLLIRRSDQSENQADQAV